MFGIGRYKKYAILFVKIYPSHNLTTYFAMNKHLCPL